MKYVVGAPGKEEMLTNTCFLAAKCGAGLSLCFSLTTFSLSVFFSFFACLCFHSASITVHASIVQALHVR